MNELSADTKRSLECSICSNIFVDPRLLKCLHTFCKTCLVTYAAVQLNANAAVTCPLCRVDIDCGTVEDIDKLPQNIHVKNIISLFEPDRDLEVNSCENCTDVGALFVGYCNDCRHRLCDECVKAHRRTRLTSSHQVTSKQQLTDLQISDILRQGEVQCSMHSTEKISMFCVDCQKEICGLCLLEEHKPHHCDGIGKLSAQLVDEFSTMIRGVKDDIGLIKADINCLVEEAEALNKMAMDTVLEIDSLEQRLIKKIQEDSRVLRSKIEKHRACAADEFAIRKMKTETQLSEMRSFVAFSEQISKYGSNSAIVQTASSLRARHKKLQPDVTKKSLLCTSLIAFHPRSFILESLLENNLIGEVTVTERPSKVTSSGSATFDGSNLQKTTGLYTPVTVHRLETGLPGDVCGLAYFQRCVYIILCGSGDISVYDEELARRVRGIRVPRLKWPVDMALNEIDQCLYVLEYDILSATGLVYRVNALEDKEVTSWSVTSHPISISVTESPLVLITFDDMTLKSFTMDGILVQHIRLPSDLEEPQHAIWVQDEGVFVCHGSYGASRHGVTIIDGSSNIRHGWTSLYAKDSSFGCPCHLIFDNERRRLFVACGTIHRVVIFTEKLEFEMIVDFSEDEFDEPQRLCLDHINKRLYVGLNDGKVKLLSLM